MGRQREIRGRNDDERIGGGMGRKEGLQIMTCGEGFGEKRNGKKGGEMTDQHRVAFFFFLPPFFGCQLQLIFTSLEG